MMREFAIVPIDMRPVYVIVALSAGLLFVGIAVAMREQPMLGWVALTTLPVIAAIFASIRRQRVILDGDRLTIVAGMHRIVVPANEIDMDNAKIAALSDTPGLRPIWKTFGTSMPGYRGGRFRLRDRRPAFALLTSKQKVLSLPTHQGRVLLLSLERPQALLDALRDVARTQLRR